MRINTPHTYIPFLTPSSSHTKKKKTIALYFFARTNLLEQPSYCQKGQSYVRFVLQSHIFITCIKAYLVFNFFLIHLNHWSVLSSPAQTHTHIAVIPIHLMTALTQPSPDTPPLLPVPSASTTTISSSSSLLPATAVEAAVPVAAQQRPRLATLQHRVLIYITCYNVLDG